jgi:iron complex transport system substrate-binding protein
MLRPSLLALALVATPALALDCAQGERAFSHRLLEGGERCIPADPQRIAFVETTIIPAYLLGTESVVNNVYFDYFMAAYPGAVAPDWIAATPDIGYLPEADVEVIAAAAPDLIVSGSFWAEENARLSRIAPVVSIDYDGTSPDWLEIQDFVAALLGQEAALADQIAAYDARLADLRQRLGPEAPSIAIARTTDTDGQLQVFTSENFGAQILLSAGFTLHPGVLSPEAAAALNRPYWYHLSMERVGDLAADWLIHLPGWEPAMEPQTLASPLWASLAPVAEGRVLRPSGDGQHWVRDNIAFAHLVLDEVYAQILRLPPAEVPPNPYADWRIVP